MEINESRKLCVSSEVILEWENKAAQLKNYFETMQVKLKTVIS